MSSGQSIEGGRGALVLVVEDHPDTQSMVAEHLTERGFEVVVAADGITAMQIVRDRRPDIVYLDVNLPHISGYDVCEQIRADPELKDTAIVMTSARHSIDVHAYSLEAGADVYMPKPYNFEQLTEHFERLCRRGRTTLVPQAPTGPKIGVSVAT
jgi:DNA-binding response OmpR family regulator